MTEHDRTDDAQGGTTSHPVPSSLTAPIVPTGPSGTSHFDPVSLRPAIDASALEDRLAELGASRSTAALGERADLLRMLGRLDEALAISEEAFRLAHFTGDRADSTAARIRRAYVFKEQGRLERALSDLHTSRLSASTEEWHELEAAAAELEGYTLYDLQRYEEARQSLAAALEAYEKAGAPAERTNGLRVAIEGVMRAVLQGSAPAAPEPIIEPEPEPAAEPMVSTVVVDAPVFADEVAGETSAVDSEDDTDARVTDDRDDADATGDTNPAPLFRTTGSPAFLVSPSEQGSPARLDPSAPRLDPSAPTSESITDAASIGVETQAIAIPHATAPGRSRRDIDDEDRNEDDEPANGFDAEVNRARKAARSIWGAFDASQSKTPPSDRS
ncbi:tetratricopeptide repeat protein [Frondihabitans sp. VKM Ac-2883]|uniref:tetratricopeptide repeat protein n=1 Tax=Frondihabitans sp. VKM Ac-2883 TaxID=2783823 RepID=UPI00188C43AD|nr:tetratricopeptide repeat protein [Frondihabitans sp. VKM Ac-2883]MBF4574976.1 tetratricopeptide repeat protein [Frondihabitans sp. VKM Ac-2883]